MNKQTYLLGVVLLFINQFIFSQEVIIVDAKQPWTDTGLDVVAGQNIYIISQGIASTSFDPNTSSKYWYWSTPNGMGNTFGEWQPATTHLVNNVPAQSLVGKIGSEGAGFFVGQFLYGNIPQSGRLYLGFNDYPGFFNDNFGYFVSFIFYGSSLNKVAEINLSKPSSFQLYQNFPNPFNPTTEIQYGVNEEGIVNLNIFNSNGKMIKSLINQSQRPGNYSIIWDGIDNNGILVSSGQYYYQIKQNNHYSTKKALLIK